MLVAPALSLLQRPSMVNRRRIIRTALAVISATSVLAALARTASAQSSSQAIPASARSNQWEFRFTSGAFVPIGKQRDALDDAQVSAAQLSWVIRPSLAITGTFGWARSRDIASAEAHKLDVFTTDLGIELRGAEMFADRAVTFTPFAGVGGGARSYNYRKLDVDATNNLAAYGTVGGEIGMGRFGVRLEMRDYASGFRPLTNAGKSATRNDALFMVGLRFDRKRSHNN